MMMIAMRTTVRITQTTATTIRTMTTTTTTTTTIATMTMVTAGSEFGMVRFATSYHRRCRTVLVGGRWVMATTMTNIIIIIIIIITTFLMHP